MKTLEFQVTLEGCWNVISHCKGSTGYPHWRRRGKTITISRWVYEYFNEVKPENLLVCHHCDNPLCINPDHLFLGSATDNAQDKMKKGRLDMSWKRKLSLAEAREIKYSKEWEIWMDKYQISPGTIAQIRSGRSYREV